MGGRALVLPQQVMTEATALAGTYVQSGQNEQQSGKKEQQSVVLAS
jgi:hypothetical protein